MSSYNPVILLFLPRTVHSFLVLIPPQVVSADSLVEEQAMPYNATVAASMRLSRRVCRLVCAGAIWLCSELNRLQVDLAVIEAP